MLEVPPFFRTETWHPLTVHWPIVLLTIGSLFFMAGYWKNNYLYPASRILLWLGVLGTWLSIYTGDLADGVVARKLCDPTVLKQHENFAYSVAYLFTGALIANLGNHILSLKEDFKRYMSIFTIVLMISGLIMLAYVGHLGGRLVYQQAAGVYQPSENCQEFE